MSKRTRHTAEQKVRMLREHLVGSEARSSTRLTRVQADSHWMKKEEGKLMKRCLMIALFLLAALVSCKQADLKPGQGFLDVPGGPVWYRVVGAGTGTPILLLHGGPGGTSCGFSLLDALGEERAVVRYDQLGSGRSGRPDNLALWQRQRFVEELHSVRQQLGLTRMHLLGSSWGSALAVQYLLEKGRSEEHTSELQSH